MGASCISGGSEDAASNRNYDSRGNEVRLDEKKLAMFTREVGAKKKIVRTTFL